MKSILALLSACVFACAWAPAVSAKTVYVDAASGSDANDGLTVGTPLRTLQAAVDLAEGGDEVLAAPGSYAEGGRPATAGEGNANTTSNRVCIEKSLLLRASSGPAVTFIVGAPDGSATDGLGPAATRCLYASSSEIPVVIEGFTLTNGFTDVGDWEQKGMGGGAFSSGAVTLTNCVMVGNVAMFGGGAANGTLIGCHIRNNRALEFGGGLYECTTYNSLIVANQARSGGGGVYGQYYNCTLAGNRATESSGGVRWYGNCNNTILYYNEAPVQPNYDGAWNLSACCTWPAPQWEGSSIIDAEPRFADTNGWADLRLTVASLCIDGGSAYGNMPTCDLDQNPRPAGAPPESPAAVCTLTLRGAILPPVIRLPNRLDLGVVPPGSVATGTLSLVSGRCGPFALNAVALHDTDARAEFTAHQTATNQEVRLLIPAPPSCGPFAGLAVAATDLPEAPTVPIQYGGRVAPYLEARPNVLAPPGDAQPLQARLTVSSPYGQPFRILAAACTDPRISVTTAARSDRHVTVSVTSAPLAPRPDNALVRLTTDHPLCRTLEIPIRTVILR